MTSQPTARRRALAPRREAKATELLGLAVGYHGTRYAGRAQRFDAAWTTDCEVRESYRTWSTP